MLFAYESTLNWLQSSTNTSSSAQQSVFLLWRTRIVSYLADVLEHLILFLLAYVTICVLLYVLIVHWKTLSFQTDVREPHRRVLLVIAHPDDETMFFGPTLLRFTKDPNCVVYLLCLSAGWNYGMDQIRKSELYRACQVLGIREECVLVHKHSKLPDAIDQSWPAEVVAQIVANYVGAFDIDTLITFDRYGVSRHANHCSIYFAIALLCMEKRIPKNCNVYVLESINLLRKYWHLFDLPICFVLSRIRFFSDSNDRLVLYRAMQMHKSQFVWFRRLYMLFSRYQLINTLQKMDFSDIELDLNLDD